MKKNRIQAILLLGILLVNLPLFFDIYRQCAFNIVPHDDYVPYLLYILGEGGSIPNSPTGYRFLSVLIAAPFYYMLPLFKYSLLEGVSDEYLKGLEALSFVSYLAASLSAFFIYKISKKKFKGPENTAILAALITLFLFRFTAIYSVDPTRSKQVNIASLSLFTAIYSVDPTAIFLICVLLYYLDSKWIFAFLIILSVGVNEKIAFLFFMLFGGRQFWKNVTGQSIYFLFSIIAFLIYFLIRKTIDLPGHEYMVQPSMFFEKATHTIKLLFTMKSFMLNWIPGIMTLGLFFLALKEYKEIPKHNKLYFSPIDFLPIIGFIVIALITDMQYTIGRILLFCFPLYLPLATLYIVRLLKKTTNIG